MKIFKCFLKSVRISTKNKLRFTRFLYIKLCTRHKFKIPTHRKERESPQKFFPALFYSVVNIPEDFKGLLRRVSLKATLKIIFFYLWKTERINIIGFFVHEDQDKLETIKVFKSFAMLLCYLPLCLSYQRSPTLINAIQSDATLYTN